MFAGIYFSQDYEADGAVPDWTSGNTGRYTVDIAGDATNHYLQVSSVGNGNNGTTITSTAISGKATDNFVIDFSLALTSGTDAKREQHTIYKILDGGSGIILKLYASGSGSTVWQINDDATKTVTLSKGVFYNFKVTVTDGKTYLSVNNSDGSVLLEKTQINSLNTSGGIGNMQFETCRYWAAMGIDNMRIYSLYSTVGYSKGTDTEVKGIVPQGETVETCSELTFPANNSLYKLGYTQTGWTRDTKNLALGEKDTIYADYTYIAAFTENSVVRTDVINTVNASWSNVALADGAAEKWYVSQSLFNGESQDVALKTNGKSFTFEAVKGIKLILPADKVDDFSSTSEFTKEGNVWTYNGENGEVTVTYNGSEDISGTFTVTYPMTSKPVVKTDLKEKYTSLLDENVELSVEYFNMETGSYQWYKNSSASTVGATAIDGATSTSYTAPTSVDGTTYYYCVGTNSLGSASSRIAMVAVDGAPNIKTDIAKDTISVLLDGDATMSVTVQNTQAPDFACQWFSNTTQSTEGGTTITGANATSYTAPTSVDGTIYYYCVTSSVYGKDTSKVATVIVDGKPIVSTNIEKKAYAMSVGEELVFTINVKNMQAEGAKYQWYSYTAASVDGTAISGANSASFTVPTASPGGTYYYCVAENVFGKDTTIVSYVSVGDYVEFDLKNWPADNTEMGNQWIWGNAENSNWVDKSTGYTSDEVDFYQSNDIVYPEGYHWLTKGWYSNDPTKDTEKWWPQQAVLYPYALAGYMGYTSGNFTIEAGTGAKAVTRNRPFHIYDLKAGDVVVITGTNLRDYDIYGAGYAGAGTFDIYVNADGTESTVVTKTDGYLSYWLRLTKDPEVMNTVETIRVVNKYAPTITTDLDGQTYTIGRDETKTLTVTATANDENALSYQWYRNSTDSNKGGTQIYGATSATYTTVATESYYYYCVVTNSGTGAAVATSNTTHVQCKPQLTYANNDASAIGEVLASKILEIGEKFTVVNRNRILYKPGYTLTAWTDSLNNKYEFGQSYDIVNDITLYPVFTAKKQKMQNIVKNTEITFNLGTSGDAHPVAWTDDSKSHSVVVQGTVSNETQDLAAIVKTTGYDNSTVRGAYAAIANGTTITLPVKYYSTITITAKEGETPSATVAATDISSVDNNTMTQEGNVLTYQYKGGDSILTVTLSAGNYEKIVISNVPSGAGIFLTDLDDNYYTETNKSITLSVDATDGVTYQWYKNTTASNTGGTLITGATSSSYTVSSSKVGSEYYYVVIHNNFGDVKSNCAQVDYFEYTTLNFVDWDADDANESALTGKWEWDMRGGAKNCNYLYPYGLAGYIAVQEDGQKIYSGLGIHTAGSGNRRFMFLDMKKGQRLILTGSNVQNNIYWTDAIRDGSLEVYNCGTYKIDTIDTENSRIEMTMLTDGNLGMYQARWQNGNGVIYSVTLPNKFRPVITKDLDSTYVVDKDETLKLEIEAELAADIDGHSLAYQWYVNTVNSNKGGVAIDGATASTYTIEKVDSAAVYYCLVYNAGTGTITPSVPASVGYYVNVTFENNDANAEGECPESVKMQSGLPLTMSVNKTLYKKGYTLTGWTDNTTTVKIGEIYTPATNVTLYPVFTKNPDGVSLAERSEAMSQTWQFAQVNGAAKYTGNESANVNQTTIKGVSIDLGIKMSDGDNVTDEDYAAEGWMATTEGEFTIPVVRNAVVTVNVYKTAGITIAGETLAYKPTNGAAGDVTYTYTYKGTDDEITLNIGNNYIRSITVDYPAPPTLKLDKSDVSVFISGEKVQSRTAVVTLTGRYLEPGSQIQMTKDANGSEYTITPSEITVAADGTINRQLLITYNATGVKNSTVSVVSLTDGEDANVKFKVTYGRKSAFTTAADLVAISRKTIFDWANGTSTITPEENAYMSFADVVLENNAAWPAGVTPANLGGSGRLFANNSTGSFEGGELRFKTEVDGTVEVVFSNVDNTSSVLVVNGENTSYTSNNTTTKITAKDIPVEAGEVVLQGRVNGMTDGNANLRIYKVTFTPNAQTPTITIDESTSSFTLSTTDALIADDNSPIKEKIYYTIDGSTPTPQSARYEIGKPVRLNTNVTIKAIAVATDKNNSAIAEKTTKMKTYTLNVHCYPEDAGTVTIDPVVENNTYTLNSTVKLKGTAKSGYGMKGWTTSRVNIGTETYAQLGATYEVVINGDSNDYWAVFSTGHKGTTTYDVDHAVFLNVDGKEHNAQEQDSLRAIYPIGKDEFKKTVTSRSIASPSNYPLHTSEFLDGSAYTLKYWRDATVATKIYELGANTLYPDDVDEVTLVPVYVCNKSATFMQTRRSRFTAQWNLTRGGFAHPFTIPSGKSKAYFSTHAKMSYYVGGDLQENEDVDLAIMMNTEDVATTDEAISNEDIEDWCIIKRGTKITIPSAYGAKITLASYANMNDKSIGGTTINGVSPDNINDETIPKNADGAYLYTWTIESNNETAELVIGSDYGYYQYILLDMPDAVHVYLDYSSNNVNMGTVTDDKNAEKKELGYSFDNGATVTLTAKRKRYNELDYWIDGSGNKIYPNGKYQRAGSKDDSDFGNDGVTLAGIEYKTVTNEEDSCYKLSFIIGKSFKLQAVFKEKTSYTVSFRIPDNIATEGAILPQQKLEATERFVLPDYNYNLYYAGHTLKYYTEIDVPDVHYEFGHSYPLTHDMTLIPVFTANEMALTEVQATEGVTATWNLASLPTVNYTSAAGIVVTQVALDENNTIDVKLDIARVNKASVVTANGECAVSADATLSVPTTSNCLIAVQNIAGVDFIAGDVDIAGATTLIGNNINTSYTGDASTQNIVFKKAAKIQNVSVTYKPLADNAELSGVKIGTKSITEDELTTLKNELVLSYDYAASSVYSANDAMPEVTATAANGTVVVTAATAANPEALILLKNSAGVVKATYTILFNLTGKTAPSLTTAKVNTTEVAGGTVKGKQAVTGTVTLTFDHAMKAKDVESSALGQTLTSRVSGRTITLSYWRLSNNKSYTLTIPANTFTDVYGKEYASDINVTFTTEDVASIEPKLFDFVVTKKFVWNSETQTASDTVLVVPEDVVANLDSLSIPHGTLEEGTDLANANGGASRFRIFVPNGEYSMRGNTAGAFTSIPTTNNGKVTKVFGKNGTGVGEISLKMSDYNNGGKYYTGRTMLRVNNISIVGQSQTGTVIYNDPYVLGNDKNATMYVNDGVSDTYFQDMTIEDRFCNFMTGSPNAFVNKSGGGAGAFYDNGIHTIAKQVTMKAHEATYYSSNANNNGYYEDCALWGTRYFMYGAGQCWWENPTVVMRYVDSPCIGLLMHASTTPWGFVLNNGTIKAENTRAYDKCNNWYGLGSKVRNSPAMTYLYTTMEVLPKPEGWDNYQGTGEVLRMHEYGSKGADGTLLDLSSRSLKALTSAAGSDDCILTSEEAAQYTLHNVLGGDNAYDPTVYTEQVSMAGVEPKNNTDDDGNTIITWKEKQNALCYFIFRIDEETGDTVFYTMSTYNHINPGEKQAGRRFVIRAANERGGLGDASEIVTYEPLETYAVEVKQVGPDPEKGWSTVCLPKDVTFSDNKDDNKDITVYTALRIENNNTLRLKQVSGDDGLKACRGYIIYATPGTYYFHGTYKAVKQVAGTNGKYSLLDGNPEDHDVTVGTLNIYTLAYKRSIDSTGVGFYKFVGSRIPARKAYLQTSTLEAAGIHLGAKGLQFSFFGEEEEEFYEDPTAVSGVKEDTDDDATVYDLSGKPVDPDQMRKGMIYIIGGKKVMYDE